MERERLGSRLGFILLSAGCAIGCGNVWKFPWMCGQYGGGGFVLIYVLCLLLLGLPVMTMEFAVGRAAQASPLHMYQKLERKGQKWHIHGYVAFFGNIALMAFYTVVTGWIVYYFVKFLTGQTENLGFVAMITNPGVNVTYLAVTVIVAFTILCFNLQGGLERISKYMMTLLLVLMVVLAVHSATLSGAAEGLKFYLVPDFSKITGTVIVGAMNQAFFTLSVGMGSMAIFGSYIGKERSLLGESVNVIVLDTFVAIVAGLIMFPACYTYGLEVNAGPSLLFDTMASVFNHMAGAVLPVHGLCRAVHGAGRVREHPRHGPRDDRVEAAARLPCVRRGRVHPRHHHGAGLQRVPFPAVRRGHGLARPLGLPRLQQHPAARLARLRALLLQQVRLGLGQFPRRGQRGQGLEGQGLDEAHLPLFCTCGDPVHLSVWDVHLYLAVKTGQIGAEFAG